MPERVDDQASGLRRLFGGPALCALGVAGSGATAVTLNLAEALAQQGQRVLVLDRMRGEIAAALGLRARFDLAQALAGDVRLADALVAGSAAITVLPAARGLDRLAEGGGDWRARLAALLAPIAAPYDAWLINGVPPAGANADVLLVVAPTPRALTEAYARIKLLNRDHGRGELRVVVDRANSETAARGTYQRVAETARRFLGARLDYLGYLPREDGAPGALPANGRSERAHAFRRLAASVAPAQPCATPAA